MLEGHHHGLKALLLRLDDLVCSGLEGQSQRQAVAAVFAEVRYLAEIHFAQEEKLMDDIDYPAFRIHAGEHRTFLDVLSKFESEGAGKPVAGLLAAWWSMHTLQHDRQLTDFLCLSGEPRDESDS